jgi:hypothetical protein
MGMDVFGRKPTNKQGEYFRNSIWGWHPLASYVCVVAPEFADHCENWHTNDGDGLNAEDSAALADKLQQEIDSGRTERFAVIQTGRPLQQWSRRSDLQKRVAEEKPDSLRLLVESVVRAPS